VAETAPGDGRTLKVQVVPPPGAELLGVQITGLASARVEGRLVPLDQGALDVRFFAPPAAGVEISIRAASSAPVLVRAASQRAGLPAEATPALGARPPDRMAKPGMLPPWEPLLESDRTIVARSATR
jgi:hypothetical protein